MSNNKVITWSKEFVEYYFDKFQNPKNKGKSFTWERFPGLMGSMARDRAFMSKLNEDEASKAAFEHATLLVNNYSMKLHSK